MSFLQNFILSFFLFFILSFVYCEDLCFTQTPPAPLSDMEACCWYEESTCCDNGLVELIYGEQNLMFSNLTEYYEDDLHDVIKCVSYFQNFLCVFCDPVNYLSFSLSGTSLTLCTDYCNGFYDACSGLPSFDEMEELGVDDGTSLCEAISDLDLSGSKKQTGMKNTMHIIQRGIKQTMDDPLLTIVVSDTDCFLGADVNTVATAECTPWGGDYTPTGEESSDNYSTEDYTTEDYSTEDYSTEDYSTEDYSTQDYSSNEQSSQLYTSDEGLSSEENTSQLSPGGSSDEDNNEESGGFSLYWLFIIVGGVFLVCIIVIIASILVILLAKKRGFLQSSSSQVDNNYPQLDELADE